MIAWRVATGLARACYRALTGRPLRPRPDPAGFFAAEDIGRICAIFYEDGPAQGTRWDAFRHAHMRLPEWFVRDLDPLGDAYAEQQHRLWQLVSGVDRRYDPLVDEKEHPWEDVDPVRTPGFYVRRDPQAVATASDHLIATGMLMKHSRLKPGDRALEYGAGFGNTALTLARLGVRVDTVDISKTFCEFVRRQAEFFQVPLEAFHGQFGMNPRPSERYRLIWFYESFHHCLDFRTVVKQLGEHLAPGGQIILAGEPIEAAANDAVPYPWGVRLHSEVVAVVRRHHWFELGFTEKFLMQVFEAEGFDGKRVDCDATLFGRLHVFVRKNDPSDA